MTASGATISLHSPELSLGDRGEQLQRLEHETFDLAIVGGGITGAGIALDAATRGLRVALVEKRDFASGTSSRSTKLIHGGLRYLAQYEFGLTREALAERGLLQRLAPVLVEPVPFLFPIYTGTLDAIRIGAGLWIYDLMAGIRGARLHRRLSRQDALKRAPGLEPRGLGRAFVYYDCRTDDSRLVVEVLRTAVGAGAVAANYVRANGYARANGRVVGVECQDTRTGKEFLLRAKRVVLACGVWLSEFLSSSDELSASVSTFVHGGAPGARATQSRRSAQPRIRPSKGVHLVVSRERFGADTAFILPTGADGRLVFVIPWQDHTLIGTTDTAYDGALDAPMATKNDVEYLLEVVNRLFPEAHLSIEDVLGLTAGLRPLVDDGEAATTHVSREDRVFEAPGGLIVIAGGKLTTYRRMARKVVDLVVRRLVEDHELDQAPECVTDKLGIGAFGRLAGVPDVGESPQLDTVVDAATHDYLVRRYGANARRILELAARRPDLRTRLLAHLPTIAAEVAYAARYEMATTVGDFLIRRTHLALFDREQATSAAAAVAQLLGAELGWTDAEIASSVQDYYCEARQYSARVLQ